METIRPRKCAGVTSAMYMGEMLEARPIAMPPTMRQSTNCAKLPAHPVRVEETANRQAAKSNKRFRPQLSAKTPERIEPKRHPKSAQLLAQPRKESLESP